MTTKRTRRAWILCVVFGAGVLALLAWFTAVIPRQTCRGGQPKGTSARLAGSACLVGALMVVVGLNYFPAQQALPAGSGLIWIVVFLYAAQAAVRRAPTFPQEAI